MRDFQKVLITSTIASFLCATAPTMVTAQDEGPKAPCLLGGGSYSHFYAVGFGDISIRCEDGIWQPVNDISNPANCLHDNGNYSAGAVIQLDRMVGIVCMNGGQWEDWPTDGGT